MNNLLQKNQLAEDLFNKIGYGHGNAVKRPKQNPNVDRALRKLISNANANGDCIISGENGYYRPLKDSNYDSLEFNSYIKQEQARVKSIENKISAMQENYENVEKEYLESKKTGKKPEHKQVKTPAKKTSVETTTARAELAKEKSKEKAKEQQLDKLSGRNSSKPSNKQIDTYLKDRRK